MCPMAASNKHQRSGRSRQRCPAAVFNQPRSKCWCSNLTKHVRCEINHTPVKGNPILTRASFQVHYLLCLEPVQEVRSGPACQRLCVSYTEPYSVQYRSAERNTVLWSTNSCDAWKMSDCAHVCSQRWGQMKSNSVFRNKQSIRMDTY